MKKTFFFIFVLLALGLQAQKHSLNPQSLNKKLLEQIILKKINYVRDTLGLSPLINDNILTLAAYNQSKFLVKNKKLTHTQPSKKYAQPHNRVAAYNGSHSFVAENIAYIPIISSSGKQIYKTYEYLADKFVKNWVKSPGHFKNIKSDRAATSGVAIAYDPKTKKIYATQVFGNKPFIGIKGQPVPSNLYGLKNPYATQSALRNCQSYFKYEKEKPSDVMTGVYVNNGYIYFVMNDARYYNQLIRNVNDGFAVDLVLREQLACGQANSLAGSYANKGLLLMPRYQNDIKATMKVGNDRMLTAILGKIPDAVKGKEFEVNLLTIQNKNVCRYQEFFNLERYKWQLLKMPFLTKESKVKNSELGEKTLSKTMKFVIPFQKGKSNYNTADIKPLYDSLRLTDYDITHIKIRAYASVEGSEEINHSLQKERANSIVKALQSFQTKKMIPEILTAENWAEFSKDIKETKYSYLRKLSKLQVKNKLRSIGRELEPILSKHRKGIVYLELEKKITNHFANANEIIQEFDKSIKEHKLEKALQIQEHLASLNASQEFPKDSYKRLTIPKKSEYSLLLNNQAIIFDEPSYKELFVKLIDLHQLSPKNATISYNLAVTAIHLWAQNDPEVSQQLIDGLIKQIATSPISRMLKERLKLNYLIVLSEYLFYQKQYEQKNRVIGQIRQKYLKLKLNEDDVLNLAQYLAAYNKFKWAEQLVRPYARKIDVNENLLFYYINLTVIDKKIVNKSGYREILLNAMNINQKRFCKIFNANDKGGITFQLLENSFLKRNYCDGCSR